MVGVCDFTKFRIPPPLSFELKTMSRIFPCPGAEKPIHPPCIPRHIPLVGPGSYPRGKPMTCALLNTSKWRCKFGVTRRERIAKLFVIFAHAVMHNLRNHSARFVLLISFAFGIDFSVGCFEQRNPHCTAKQKFPNKSSRKIMKRTQQGEENRLPIS